MKIEKTQLILLHIRFKPFVDKLINGLRNKHIIIEFGDENISFSRDGKQLRISYWCFYRQSGIVCLYKNISEREVEIIDITDSMFIEGYMKPSVELFFGEFKMIN